MTTDAAVEAAVALHRDGRVAEAEEAYRALLAQAPIRARAAHNLAAILLQRKEVEAALHWFAAAVAADPGGVWRSGYVRALLAQGRFEDAETVLADAPDPWSERRVLELELHQRWAFAFLDSGNLAKAETQFLKVLALAPDDADALADFGVLQLRRGRPAAGVDSLERAVQIAPGNLVALLNFAATLRALDRRPEAEGVYRRVLTLEPNNVTARRGLEVLNGGTVSSPSEVLAHEALVLRTAGRTDEALKRIEQAVALNPDNIGLRYERGYIRLFSGDFGGWDDYEARLSLPVAEELFTPGVHALIERDVERASLAGADLVVAFEQGIGDQIMFASMLPDLAAEAGHLTCLCDPRLVRLFSSSFPNIHFTDSISADGRRVIAAGSLGRLYRRTAADFPATPYLRVRPDVRAGWAARVGPRPERLRVGLSWRGGTAITRAHRRSLPLEALGPLLDLPGCDYVSLQYGDPRPEVETVNRGLARPMRVFPPGEIDDLEDLAALVQNLDVVVSVQTAMAHLCGALGARCLVLMPHQAEWRYGATGATIPWYGSVRLLRPPAVGAWAPVIAAAREALMAPSG